ncbi:putative transposase domain protein (plasmid) [Sphingobium sp. RAC03]|nr:putative transposase domain protein [Sphingobium sp. RAC03]
MTVVARSCGEFSRYNMLRRVQRPELRVQDAATLIGMSRQRISRLTETGWNVIDGTP